MPAPWSELYVHLVWSTCDRKPFINEEVEKLLVGCIRADCAKLKAKVIAIGMVPDHVHILVRLPTTVSVAGLVKQLKGSSSHLINMNMEGGFKWQGGYGAFTVSKEAVPQVKRYVLNQKSHHDEGSCREEWERTSAE